MTPSLAYAGRPGIDLAGALAAFGTDWLWFGGPALAVGLVLVLLARRAPAHGPFLHRMSAGAAQLSGLPAWCAGGLVLATASLLIAVQGFFWDVGWHIAIGRDELLLSPPHLSLLLGISLIALAGLTSASVATRSGAEVGWRVDRWRIPYGAAALITAGLAAIVGFGVDELWHAAYGLDVTMWSPPHLVMVSAGGLAPISTWLLLAEAGRGAGSPQVRRVLGGLLAGAVVIGLSVWQLELDFGLSQWPMRYHPILVALAAGFGLTAARAALGRGGALIAVAVFVGIRGGLAVLTSLAWGLSATRFVPYLAGAVAVELAFARRRDLAGLRGPLLAGAGVGTLGLAGAAAATHLWGWHPWQPSLLPTIPVAAAVAVAAAVLGAGFGRAMAHRPTSLSPPVVAVSIAVVAIGLASPLPRLAPDATVTVSTSPAAAPDGELFEAADAVDLVEVAVAIDPTGAADAADRFEVIAWQGGGFAASPLERVAPGRYVAAGPVPVGGTWKTMVRIGAGRTLGAAPVAMPADPEIGAPPIALPAERTVALVPDVELMLRERTEGPAWPGILGYGFTALGLGLVLALQVAGVAGLERRRAAAPGRSMAVPRASGR